MDFTIQNGKSSYVVRGKPENTLEVIWASQKCWFGYGAQVTITDENGNSQTFNK